MDLQGLYPPIPTPYDNGRVSPEMLADNLSRWAETPLDGYVVLGSNGEAPLLEEEEKEIVIKAARKAVPKGTRLLIAGTGRESTAAAVLATRRAFDAGVDAVLVGAPSYFKPVYNDDDLLESYYREVADRSPGPIFLYSVPQFSGVTLTPELVRRLAGHPRVAGIKDSGGDLDHMKTLIRAGEGESFTVLSGSARLLAAAVEAGARGGVLAVANVAPALCASIVEAASGGERGRAAELNEKLVPLARAVTTQHGIGGLKAAMDLLGYHGGDPRPPLPAAGETARREIESHLRVLELLP